LLKFAKKPTMRRLKIIVAIVLSVVILSFITNHGYIWGGIQETYFRGWKNSNIDDIEFRDLRVLDAADATQPWAMALNEVNPFTAEDELWNEDYLTASFLVIHRDTIRFEQYWQGHDERTLTNSFSACKSIVALAIGLAADQGLLDVHDSVAQYLPRFAGDAGRGLTIQEVLQMRSHIPFGESYSSPFGFMAKAYYREDIRSLVAPYTVTDDPGSRWKYEGGNTMLLEEILASLGKGSLSDWVERGFWQPMGAENDAFWGLDAPEDEGGVERCFAQFYATTRDYARFGKLLNQGGKWGDLQLLSEEYTKALMTPIAGLTDACDAEHYGYQIWLGETESGRAFSCMEGLRGQMIISVPELDLIVVRMGYSKEEVKKGELPSDIYRVLEMGLRNVSLEG
jgi:CubicO group peptidase (beta-lactamase class C family)